MDEQQAAEGYPPLYLQGIELFNDCEYFEAHDVWEELWTEYQGSLREFYKGLIQAAVCLHHFGNGNTRGARKLLNSSTRYLQQYCPREEGIDLDKFLAEMQTCCAEIVASEEEYPKVEIVPDLLPEIHLQ